MSEAHCVLQVAAAVGYVLIVAHYEETPSLAYA